MQRVVGALMLVICACVVAGCGGSALDAKARKVVGDPHATVVSTETVDALGGGRLMIVVMKPGGSQGLGCVFAQQYVGGSTPQSRCPLSQDAYVALGAKTHADMGDEGISKWQVAAIAKARANPRFWEYPIVNQLTVRCAIPNVPEIGRAKAVPSPRGICATFALPFGGPVRCVAFAMGWRPKGGKMYMTAWVVRFDRNGHVQSTLPAAHPPQRWSGHQPNTCSQII